MDLGEYRWLLGRLRIRAGFDTVRWVISPVLYLLSGRMSMQTLAHLLETCGPPASGTLPRCPVAQVQRLALYVLWACQQLVE